MIRVDPRDRTAERIRHHRSDLGASVATARGAALRDAVLVLGFALLTAALAQVQIHLSFTPVPITGQTLGVLLAGGALGATRGGLSQLLYWRARRSAGLPFYADHTGGWESGTGTTFGYFIGLRLRGRR